MTIIYDNLKSWYIYTHDLFLNLVIIDVHTHSLLYNTFLLYLNKPQDRTPLTLYQT